MESELPPDRDSEPMDNKSQCVSSNAQNSSVHHSTASGQKSRDSDRDSDPKRTYVHHDSEKSIHQTRDSDPNQIQQCIPTIVSKTSVTPQHTNLIPSKK